MNKEEVTALYYKCIDRIDDNVELAEEYLINAVTYLVRKKNGRADKDRITEDFLLSRGLGKYVEELTIISRVSEECLATILASSLDLSKVIDRIRNIHDKIESCIYDDVEAHNQTSKIDEAIKLFSSMKRLVQDKGGHIQRGLFEELK